MNIYKYEYLESSLGDMAGERPWAIHKISWLTSELILHIGSDSTFSRPSWFEHIFQPPISIMDFGVRAQANMP